MSSRVLLINPPVPPAEIYGPFAAIAPRLPALGLGYLSAFLRRRGHHARVVDACGPPLDLDGLRSLIVEERPDVVGVTATTASLHRARQVLRAAKALSGRCLTVLGGAHVSAMPRQALEESPEADLGVTGEGEHTLLEICDRHRRGSPLDDIAGTVVRTEGRIHVNASRAPEANIDLFPPPDRDLLRGEASRSHTPFRGTRSTVSMISSRGCPHGCGYCDQSVFGRTWRAHSATRVVEEMELARRLGADFVSFEDDNFALDQARVVEICRGLQRERMGMEWGCSVRISDLDRPLLREMGSAGCRVIYVGIESASPRILELMERRVSIEQVRRGVRLIKEAGIRAYGAFVLGSPTETRQDIRDTIDLALELPLDGASFFLYVPYPHTRLRRLAQQVGDVSADWSDYSAHPRRPPFVARGISAEELLRLQRLAYRRFFMRWRYVSGHLPMILTPSFVRGALAVLLQKHLGREQA